MLVVVVVVLVVVVLRLKGPLRRSPQARVVRRRLRRWGLRRRLQLHSRAALPVGRRRRRQRPRRRRRLR